MTFVFVFVGVVFGPAQMEAFLHNIVTDTTAIVGRLNSRVVVTFRGTASRKNFLTDLKVSRGTVTFKDDQDDLIDQLPGGASPFLCFCCLVCSLACRLFFPRSA